MIILVGKVINMDCGLTMSVVGSRVKVYDN